MPAIASMPPKSYFLQAGVLRRLSLITKTQLVF